jgi:hypothetical protein
LRAQRRAASSVLYVMARSPAAPSLNSLILNKAPGTQSLMDHKSPLVANVNDARLQ